MTENAPSQSFIPRHFLSNWRPLAVQSIALSVALWFLPKVVPVFIAVQSNLGLNASIATALNQLSHLVTVCGMVLLPVCFIAQIIAALSARPGDSSSVQRTCRVLFERALCVVVTVPLLAFHVALLSLWIPALR